MPKTNIVFIVFEPRFSGQGRAVRGLIENLSPEYEPFLLCQHTNRELQSLVTTDHCLKCNITKVISIDIIKAVHFIRENAIDLIHLHGFESLIWGHLVSIFSRKPIVFTPHTIDMKNKVIYMFFKQLWRIFTFTKTNHIITVSYNDKSILVKRKMSPAKKITPIYLAVNKQRYTCNKINDENPPVIPNVTPAFTVLQIGHLSFQKNPFCFIKAAQQIIPHYPTIMFLLAGEGPMMKEIYQYINNMKIGNRIKLLGHRKDIISVMKKVDIVVNSSYWEGMPFSLIDAAFLGKPVIATGVNGNIDLIKHNETGLLFTTNNEKELAQKIIHLYQNRKTMKCLGKKLEKSVQNKFSYKEMIDKHITIYESLR